MKKKKRIIAYAGFDDDEFSFFDDKFYYDGVLRVEIFKVKKEAQKCYEDVRKVEIREL